MIKSIRLELSGDDFEITYGTDFTVTSDISKHLVYEKNGVWHVISDPCHGKYGRTIITIPYGYSFTDFQINLTDGALKFCKINSENAELNLKNASVEADTISKNLYISISRANLRIFADSQAINIDCGYGMVDLRLVKARDGYSISSQCGIGNVTLNSSLLAKKFESNNGARKINVICGMGDVNINT